ncbi:growth hormone secretagogue receptor type 1-like [Mastacembelus armatus]|uniref:growth hormone secretagogue receptor type 1-like n=1 Tax=Mastacembelus armatus TaxID=205130 RepID=UPI00143686B2|nr:growth hormone secretagogue receptor type 1-like [Mastacembelus armatus]
MELGDMGSGCEDENCGFPQDCLNQECQLEPVFGLIELVVTTVIYIPLMLSGLLGNILTILVVWLRPHMRSSTYLYLSSMAVSDLVILLLLPLDLYKLWRPRPWPLGDLACKLTVFLSECCTFCTILHITFLSLERYLAVCWPITAKTLVTRRRTRALIGCLWLCAVISAAPVLVMVGVEEVEGEELGLNRWREGGGWTGREGQQGGLAVDGGERGSGYVASIDGGLEGIKWEESETKDWGEQVGELKVFGEKMKAKVGIKEMDGRKQGNGGETRDKTQAGEEGGEEEGKMETDRKQQNKMKEDEGGGREEDIDRGHGGKIDKRECRCTQYAVSSGLLSTMTIVSNLYFLVPFCILGLVYSLIGRTLWLRPQSSRKDQSHRHTVKMLGVIVLAFVLCWLPFHVGRTIYTHLDTHFFYYLSQYFNLVSSVLFYLSAAVNPLLYNLMSARYRHAVHSLIHTHSTTQSHQVRTTRHSTTTFHADVVPDASLDASLASLLSLNSSWALEQQYCTLQRGMTQQQRFAFNHDLYGLFGGNITAETQAIQGFRCHGI